jgi:hypothetical protein
MCVSSSELILQNKTQTDHKVRAQYRKKTEELMCRLHRKHNAHFDGEICSEDREILSFALRVIQSPKMWVAVITIVLSLAIYGNYRTNKIIKLNAPTATQVAK